MDMQKLKEHNVYTLYTATLHGSVSSVLLAIVALHTRQHSCNT